MYKFRQVGLCLRKGDRGHLQVSESPWSSPRFYQTERRRFGRRRVEPIVVEVGKTGSITCRETLAFAAAAIRRWRIIVGRRRHPEAHRLPIQADGGGAHRLREFSKKNEGVCNGRVMAAY